MILRNSIKILIIIAFLSCNSNTDKNAFFSINEKFSREYLEGSNCIWKIEDVPILECLENSNKDGYTVSSYYQFDNYNDDYPLAKFWEFEIYDKAKFVDFLKENGFKIENEIINWPNKNKASFEMELLSNEKKYFFTFYFNKASYSCTIIHNFNDSNQ